jgi:elongation factor P--(R)-beta-lysine ligase
MSTDWQSCASNEVLLLRGQLLEQIRRFMTQRNILEVDTPVLSRTSIPDTNIENVICDISIQGKEQAFYLHTSPEVHMKRLLAGGSGAIYQITKVFRDNELGPCHQPEFSMLEWYRPEFDHHKLMDEMSELLSELGLATAERKSYESVFVEHLQLNPHTASIGQLQTLTKDLGLHEKTNERSILLEFLFSHSISPKLGREVPLMLYDYPLCQAALAKLSDTEPQTALRFELFIEGMEIANGFYELRDAKQQAQRFSDENDRRGKENKALIKIDENFLQALEAGLPDCAGVAIGIDRLLMILSGKSHIKDVMTFPVKNA